MRRGQSPDIGSVLGAVLTLSATGEGIRRDNSAHAIELTGAAQAHVYAVELHGCTG